MKYLLLFFIILLSSFFAFSQEDTTAVLKVGQKYNEYFIHADSVVIKNKKNRVIEKFSTNEYPVKVFISCFHPGVYSIEFYNKSEIIYREMFTRFQMKD